MPAWQVQDSCKPRCKRRNSAIRASDTARTHRAAVSRLQHAETLVVVSENGAGEGIRTLDPNLGKIFRPLFPNFPKYDYLR